MFESLTDAENRSVFAEWSSFRGSGTTRSLDRARLFAEALRIHPQLNESGARLLGVVGSKGKGTAAVYASAALSAAGIRVGTITGPGIMSNRDRVRLNGAALSGVLYREMLDRAHEARKSLQEPSPETGYLSPSGMFLLAGLSTLLGSGCEVVVCEAGIGGRSDELSLLPLDVVVIVRIMLEHTAILGDTLNDIAADKSDVITSVTKTVFSVEQSPEVHAVIEQRCSEVGASLVIIDGDVSVSGCPTKPVSFNAAVGARAGRELAESMKGIPVSESAFIYACESVNYPGRMSCHRTEKGAVVVDSAITRDGLVCALNFAGDRFAAEFSGSSSEEPFDTILASLPVDKDFMGFVDELRDREVGRVIFVDMPGTHLNYPSRDQCPPEWGWATVGELPSLLETGRVVAVGTALFTAEVLTALGADTESVFQPNSA